MVHLFVENATIFKSYTYVFFLACGRYVLDCTLFTVAVWTHAIVDLLLGILSFSRQGRITVCYVVKHLSISLNGGHAKMYFTVLNISTTWPNRFEQGNYISWRKPLSGFHSCLWMRIFIKLPLCIETRTFLVLMERTPINEPFPVTPINCESNEDLRNEENPGDCICICHGSALSVRTAFM